METEKDYPAFAQPRNVNTVVFMQGITSGEYYLKEGCFLVPVLDGIDLTVKRGQIFGVDGTSLFELKLLLEIMANIRAYDRGRCVLHERGMMRQKRIIHPQVFYIGAPDMAYANMNVLEFLMFSLMLQKGDKILLQKALLEDLIGLGLRRYVLTPIRSLPREHRAMVLLLVSVYSKSSLVVFNLPEYHYDGELRLAFSSIAKLFRDRQKTLVLSTQDSGLIDAACTHMVFLRDGKIAFAGSVDDFRRYDTLVLTIRDERIGELTALLKQNLPQYRYDVSDDELLVYSDHESEEDAARIYGKLADLNFSPMNISVNPKTVENARAEFVGTHAIR